MVNHLRKVPNQLTAIRLIVVIIMWVCAFYDALFYMGIGFIIGAVTDAVDGAIARKLNQSSDFGSKFDSLADQLLQISSVFWILMLMPEIISENKLAFLLPIAIYLTSLSVGLIKFRRLANLHLYLSKFGGIFLYIFITHAFLVGQYSRVLLYLAMLSMAISSTETLVLQLISTEVDEHSGSIFFRYIRDDHPIRNWLSRLP